MATKFTDDEVEILATMLEEHLFKNTSECPRKEGTRKLIREAEKKFNESQTDIGPTRRE